MYQRIVSLPTVGDKQEFDVLSEELSSGISRGGRGKARVLLSEFIKTKYELIRWI